MPGKSAANTAFPKDPAFLPPTKPAINGPINGSQNSSIERTNIQIIALTRLPSLLAMPKVSHIIQT